MHTTPRALAALMLTTALTTAPLALASPRPLEPPAAGDLGLALEKLATVGSVLYVAAHPDDENTRLLAYLAGDRKVRVAYASLTRGDGGQNLVGAELGPLLGLVRTYELLAARRLDGAEQFFSRAIDFGYSKSATEALSIWGKGEVLADLVRVIRTFRPDVIVTRFDTNPPNHGHHTASALLAREAFTLAADPAYALAGSSVPHQARMLLENKSSWRFKEGEDLSAYMALDVGTYSPLLGRSFSEIAAASRTMHKSQGFGSAPEVGPTLEYFDVTALAPGVKAPGSDPFAAVDRGWERYPGTEKLRACLDKARAIFNPLHPDRMLAALAEVRDELLKLPADNPARAPKLAEVEALLVGAAGLVLDPRATAPAAVPGVPLAATASVLLRGADVVGVTAVTWPDGTRSPLPGRLARGVIATVEHPITMPLGSRYSTPFWLAEPPVAPPSGGPAGLFAVSDPAMGILPVGSPDLPVTFDVTIGGARFDVVKPLVMSEVDRVNGERFRLVEVLPPVSVTPTAAMLMLPNGASGTLRVSVMAHADKQSGTVSIQAPAGYLVTPANTPFSLGKSGDAAELAFQVTPPKGASGAAELTAVADVGGQTIALRRDQIDHLHIPARTVLSAARVKAVPVAVKTGGTRIGYIPGAGDEVAESLRQVGYDVTVLDDAALATADLSRFSAIIAGIRAYNVNPHLGAAHERLMRYVEGGGTYVVQYITSTSRRPLGDVPIGPYPFVIDQDRVTDETATMTPVDPKHRALTAPNALVAADYVGWVQERGLYFAQTWDAHYQPLFSAHDPGEGPLQGATIVARHGKGAFVYTGISFFRQLPAGVAGAYRLFANLLALGGRK